MTAQVPERNQCLVLEIHITPKQWLHQAVSCCSSSNLQHFWGERCKRQESYPGSGFFGDPCPGDLNLWHSNLDEKHKTPGTNGLGKHHTGPDGLSLGLHTDEGPRRGGRREREKQGVRVGYWSFQDMAVTGTKHSMVFMKVSRESNEVTGKILDSCYQRRN